MASLSLSDPRLLRVVSSDRSSVSARLSLIESDVLATTCCTCEFDRVMASLSIKWSFGCKIGLADRIRFAFWFLSLVKKCA